MDEDFNEGKGFKSSLLGRCIIKCLTIVIKQCFFLSIIYSNACGD
jgi:hypothetical protein